MQVEISKGLNTWLKNGDRGISSEAIASQLTGINFVHDRWMGDYPRDPSDFRRCLELLEAVPEFKFRLDEMKSKGTVWAALVDNWEELKRLYYEEAHTGKCSKLYDRMQELIKDNS